MADPIQGHTGTCGGTIQEGEDDQKQIESSKYAFQFESPSNH